MADFESIYQDEGFDDWDDYESCSEHRRTTRNPMPASAYRVRHGMEGLDHSKDSEEYRQWANDKWEGYSKKKSRKTRSSRWSTQAPSCPRCGKSMVKRLATRGFNAGKHFWGSSSFPKCCGTRSLD